MYLLLRQSEGLPKVTHMAEWSQPQDPGGGSQSSILPDGPLVPWSALQTREHRVVLDPRTMTHVTLE